MNKQGSEANPFGGIEWTHILGAGTGRTVNPIAGCEHECRWQMPDGNWAICYAKARALDMAKTKAGAAYAQGFEHVSWHPEKLAEILREKDPCGIFVDSMSDMFGRSVKRAWIESMIQTMVKAHWHVFFSLTKNASKFREFNGTNETDGTNTAWPANWFAGVSAPPSEMYGKRLSPKQQLTMFRKWLQCLIESPARRRWVSIEPLSFDVSEVLREYRWALHWAVIGAASHGRQTYQPDPKHLQRAVKVLQDSVPIFFKGNLNREFCEDNGVRWRQEYPVIGR